MQRKTAATKKSAPRKSKSVPKPNRYLGVSPQARPGAVPYAVEVGVSMRLGMPEGAVAPAQPLASWVPAGATYNKKLASDRIASLRHGGRVHPPLTHGVRCGFTGIPPS